jgi:hypothetical protein
MIFPAFSGTPKVHYRVNKTPPLILILKQMNIINTCKSYFIETRLILSSSLPLNLPNDIFLWCFRSAVLFPLLISSMSANFLTQFILLDIIKVILFGDEQ